MTFLDNDVDDGMMVKMMMVMIVVMVVMVMMMVVMVHSDKWGNVSKQGFLFTFLPLQLFNQNWHQPTKKQ